MFNWLLRGITSLPPPKTTIAAGRNRFIAVV